MFRKLLFSFWLFSLFAYLTVYLSIPPLAKTQEISPQKGITKTEVHLSLPEPLAVLETPALMHAPTSQSVVTITQETFEGAFPTDLWQVFDGDGATNGEYFWGVDDYLPGTGSWSAWAARGGADGLDPESSSYPDYAKSWMVYGPVDLSGASTAELLFDYYSDTEDCCDFFIWAASVDGTNFYGYQISGDSEFWGQEVFDLTVVPTLGDVSGSATVWIAFVFESDSSIGDVGPFVDDIVFRALYGDAEPYVSSILRAGANPTRSASVEFLVHFSEDVTGVDTTDFNLWTDGLNGAGVSSVDGSGAAYTVTVDTGTGDGLLRLDLVDDDSIQDAGGQPLGGGGTGNGDFSGGELYTLDHTSPSVDSIVRSGVSPTGASTLRFIVSFDEAVVGVNPADFTLYTTGISGASIASTSGAGTGYVISVNSGSGDGTIRLDLVDDDSITDLAGNLLGGDGAGNGNFSAGETFTIDRSLKAWESKGPFGAELNCLAKAPSNPDVMYAGTNRGIFKTTNNGTVWFQLSFEQVVVFACQVSPLDANLVYAGTGTGIYKSTDGGNSWSGSGLTGAQVNTIALNPSNPDVLFAGTGEMGTSYGAEIIGIFKSVDGGSTWQNRESTDLDSVEVIMIDTDDPTYVYAGVVKDSSGPGFYKSVDGGDTWSGRQVGPNSWDDIMALGMTPAGAATRVIYAVRPDDDVYRSEDRGETWVPTNVVEDIYSGPWTVTVDPQAASVVYTSVSGALYKSTNGGATWVELANGLPLRAAVAILIDPRDSRVFAALESGGIYASQDSGDNWYPANTGLLSSYVNDLAVHPASSAKVHIALRGWAYHLEKTSDGGATWEPLENSWRNLGAVAQDPQDPGTLYIGSDYRYRSGTVVLISKSEDAGQTWNPTGTMLTYIYPANGYVGVADILVSPVDSNLVLVAVEGSSTQGGGVYKSSNGGISWSRELSDWSFCLAVDPNDPGVYYTGSSDGYIYRSPDSGNTWINIDGWGSQVDGEINDLVVDSAGYVYAATSAGLWKWNGQDWTELGYFSDTSVSSLAIDLVEDVLYAGTRENGVHVSWNGGSSWSQLNDGLAVLSVVKLGLSTTEPKTLYAGTAYGGVWSLVLGEASPVYEIYIPLVLKNGD